MYLPCFLELCSRNCLSDCCREVYVASWVGSWLEHTDVSVRLLLGQPRGVTPSQAPLPRAESCALI